MTTFLVKAVTYSPSDDVAKTDDDMDVPLLDDSTTLTITSGRNDDDDWMDANRANIRDLNLYSSLLGIIVGIAMVLSELGARTLMLIPGIRLHLDVQAMLSKESIFFGVAWSIVTALCVVCVLQLFVAVVVTSYSVNRNKAEIPDELLFRLEVRLFLGVLFGAFISSVTADICLVGTSGTKEAILYNAASVVAALSPLAFYKLMRLTCGGSQRTASRQKQGAVLVVV